MAVSAKGKGERRLALICVGEEGKKRAGEEGLARAQRRRSEAV